MKKRKRPATVRRKSAQRLIALLSDFGDRDQYVGTMKGVILSIDPRAQIIDISHKVTPQNITEAGYLLWASYKFFPVGTVFVCVVDPGVGSARRIICLETARHQFIAPDNGLLDLVILQEEILGSYEVINPPQFGTKKISATFHGRDIFAPLAAGLSKGKSINQFGKRYELKKPSPVFCNPENNVVRARILHIDRFGNLITNIPEQYFDRRSVKVGATDISNHIHSYAEAPKAQPCILVGSSGLIEVVLKDGSASKMLNANLQTPVVVSTIGQKSQF